MATVDIRNVRKAFGSVEVLHGVSVDIADSEFVVLVGPSGCGKSTLLRMIAGLENINAGEIAIGKRVVNTLPPKDRDVAMVFQNYALYPHMTVFDNMAFSMKLANAPAAVMEREVQRAAQILGLEQLLNRYPRQLSGGQRQQSPWGAPSCAIRRSFCSMNRCPTSMPSYAFRCVPRSRRCTSA
jgi:multiple sugar transport system ATP-binding protein